MRLGGVGKQGKPAISERSGMLGFCIVRIMMVQSLSSFFSITIVSTSIEQ